MRATLLKTASHQAMTAHRWRKVIGKNTMTNSASLAHQSAPRQHNSIGYFPTGQATQIGFKSDAKWCHRLCAEAGTMSRSFRLPTWKQMSGRSASCEAKMDATSLACSSCRRFKQLPG